MSSNDDETISIHGEAPQQSSQTQRQLKHVGDYELLELVAQGGMGVVYRARQLSLNRIVAVKMIRQIEFASDADRIRFRAEAEAAAALNHPNTVPIYEVGEHAGQPYFSMRLIEGGSLSDQIAAGKWPIDNKETIRQAVRLMNLVAMAVHDAHQHGIIHRDLKPGNILVDEAGIPFVADFGLAKRYSNRDHMTHSGSIVGTPAFMSPEQAVGKEITTASDVYSLGAVLYNLIGGRPPLQADSPIELFKRLMDEPAKPVRTLNRVVDKDIETVCDRCLEKVPARRYLSARALADDLQNWLEGKPIAARPIGPIAKFYRWSKRNPMNVAVSGIAFALGLVILRTLALGYLSTGNAIEGLRRERYANRISQAAAAIEDGSPIDAEVYLSKELPSPDQSDLRGWEWYYLRQKLPIEYQLDQPYLNACWSPDGSQFAVHSTSAVDYTSRDVSVWSYPVDQPTAEFQLDTVVTQPVVFNTSMRVPFGSQFLSQLAWDPSGRFLATLLEASEFRIWDMKSKTLHSSVDWTVADAGKYESHMQWSHDGKRLAVVSQTGNIKMHQLESKRTVDWSKIATQDKSSVVTGIAWGPNDEWIAIAESKQTQFINTQTLEVSKTWPVSIMGWNASRTRWMCESGIGDADSADLRVEVKLSKSSVWSPDGRWIASTKDNRAVIIDAQTGTIVQEYFIRNALRPTWFPSSDRLLVNGKVLHNLSWSPNDLEITLPNPIALIEISRDASKVAIVSQDSNEVQILDTHGKQLTTFTGHAARVIALDWRHDDESVASLDLEGKVRVWKVRDGSQTLELALTTGDIPKQLEPADWQVHWSPDDSLLAACAEGSIVRVWEPQQGKLQGELIRKNARILGWMEDPLSLNIQIYGSFSFVFPRQRNTTNLESSNVARIINWDVLKDTTHTYSTSIMANSAKAARAWPNGDYYYAIPQYDPGFARDTLDSPKQRQSSSMFSSSQIGFGQLTQIELADPPSRVFALSDTGALELKDVDRNSTLIRLPKCSTDSLLSYAASKLWVADGNKLRLFDASSIRQGMGRSQVLLPDFLSVFINQLTVLVLIGILVLVPIWIVLDTGIKISLSRRWLFTTLIAACAAFLIAQYNLSQLNWMNAQAPNQAILAIILAAGISAFFVESLRLASIGKWVTPLLLWLCIALGMLLIVGYSIWPSAWQLEQDGSKFRASKVFVPAGFATFTIGIILFANRFTSGPYAASMRFRRAPRWVRWSLWGCKSLQFAIIITPIEVLFYAAIIWGGIIVPPPIRWILTGLGIAAMVFPVSRIFAIRWVQRNGGWEAQ